MKDLNELNSSNSYKKSLPAQKNHEHPKRRKSETTPFRETEKFKTTSFPERIAEIKLFNCFFPQFPTPPNTFVIKIINEWEEERERKKKYLRNFFFDVGPWKILGQISDSPGKRRRLEDWLSGEPSGKGYRRFSLEEARESRH